ncbi:MAG: electron transport complex subunit RsxC, partial [Candidatus Hydrogenedentes bacterium]|nr:electron transport complex subunit RsxC [Candidatus Hydrogenedentota bacterium]
MWLPKKSAPSPLSHLGGRLQATAPFSCRRLPFAAELIVPLSQHVGAPATPIVREGQEVVRGEPIARACGFLSVPMHGPATGVIRKIGPAPLPGGTGGEAIHLRVYPAATQEILYGARVRPETLTPKQIVHAVQDAGIVDACAEIVPAHTKLVLEEGQSIDTVIVNALGPAPLCATTQHVLSTQAAQISQGLRLALQSLGAQQGLIAVASGKSVGALALAKELPSWAEFDLRPVRVQSDSEVEERLVRALTGRKIPAGASAAAARCVVLNIQTIAQM